MSANILFIPLLYIKSNHKPLKYPEKYFHFWSMNTYMCVMKALPKLTGEQRKCVILTVLRSHSTFNKKEYRSILLKICFVQMDWNWFSTLQLNRGIQFWQKQKTNNSTFTFYFSSFFYIIQNMIFCSRIKGKKVHTSWYLPV